MESVEILFSIKEKEWKALIDFQKEEGFIDVDKDTNAYNNVIGCSIFLKKYHLISSIKA